MENTLVKLLHDSVQKFPEKNAIIHADRNLSYINLWKKSCGVAQFLTRQGLTSGDRISLLIENSIEYVIAYYAVLMAGGAVVGLNTAAKSRDLINWIQHSESHFLFTSSTHPELDDVLKGLDTNICQLVFLDPCSLSEEFTCWDDIEPCDAIPDNKISDPANQLASIIYTSGTTGKPKGVMLSHTNLYENTISILTYLKLNETDSIVNVLPFYYSYGNSVLHIHIAVGGTLILENSLLYPHKVVALMSETKATGFSGVPSTFNLLLNRIKFSDFDLSSLRYMTQAGGHMVPSYVKKIKNELPEIKFVIMYGQTEASARLSYLPAEDIEVKLGSIGRAIPGVELEVMDESLNPVAPNVTGEIYARGKNIMMGYWKDPDTTQSVLHDNWLKTGDLAYKDEDNYLYIVGRSSEMIKSGAHRISPKDIEEVILEYNSVEEASVVGVEDKLLGQVIKAVIVIKPEHEVTKMELLRYCKANLANYKIPKFIEFVDEIPKTASGKVRRFMLQN